MTVTTLTVKEIGRLGLSVTKFLTAATATDGDQFPNDGKTFLVVKNTNAATRTVTIAAPATVDGQALASLVVNIAATGDGDGLDFQFIGPFTSIYNQAGGYVLAICSAVTNVTVGAFRLANP
jgi:hypothetical protein